jgi:hypothetical protein
MNVRDEGGHLMRLYDILHKLDWASIEEAVLRLYPKERRHIRAHKHAYDCLMSLRPLKSRMRIHVEMRRDKGERRARGHVFGKDGTPFKKPDEQDKCEWTDREEHWGLEFVDWRRWLGMEIAPEIEAVFSGADIAAHVLWEMTFWGYDPQAIRAKEKEIFSDQTEFLGPEESERISREFVAGTLTDDKGQDDE